MQLEKAETLITIKVETYSNFKEKIAITKEYYGKAKMEIKEDYVYIEEIETILN